MATENSIEPPRKHPLWLWLAIGFMAVLLIGLLLSWPTIRAYSQTGAAYSARVVCSCRYIGERSLGDCRKDLEPGTEIVRLSEAQNSKRIDASVPFVASESAEFREGYGCILMKNAERAIAD